jgi:sugar phosphate isomerase/epimerase
MLRREALPSQLRYSICNFTAPNTTFEEDLDIAVAVGAAGVGVTESKLRAGEEKTQADALRAHGLSASICVPNNISPLPCDGYPGPSNLDERIEVMIASIQRLAIFDPDVIVVVTGSATGFARADARRIAIEGLREAARVAGDLGIALGLEPIQPGLGLNLSFIHTLPETVELLEDLDARNVGILHDFVNLGRTENILALTEQYAPMINGAHVADAGVQRGNNDRRLPGDGDIDIAGLLTALRRGGYAGWYDLEVFAADGLELDGEEALWRQPAEVIHMRGHDGFKRAWAESTRRIDGAVSV